jgi:DNA-binding transcriptional ArsR family regulator
MAHPLDALGDPTRRRILAVVALGERPAGDIVAVLRERGPISQPAVSQHLKVLLQAGLVAVRPEGRSRLYRLEPAGVEAARAWLDGLTAPLAAVGQPLDALETEVARGRVARRRGATVRDDDAAEAS